MGRRITSCQPIYLLDLAFCVVELSFQGMEGANASNQSRVMIFAGGIPLKVGGEIVGSVGVSGGSGDQDQAVAEAAAAVCS
jgi:uncharacterized protein GlcG (DUF336 family)